MKLLLLALIPAAASAANCDLGLIELKNQIGPVTYNQEVFSAFWRQGYDATAVSTFNEAKRYSYIGEVTVACTPSMMNPYYTSTVTTLTVTDTATRKIVATVTSAPQTALGSCKLDLLAPIAKLPACK